MPKRAMEQLTESMFYVLMAFTQGPLCGTQVVEFVDELTQGRVQLGPATLYTILGKFEKEGWIAEIAVEGRKRTYELAPKGQAAYEAELERLQQCLQDAAEAAEPGKARQAERPAQTQTSRLREAMT